jgi:hypothetical protein
VGTMLKSAYRQLHLLLLASSVIFLSACSDGDGGNNSNAATSEPDPDEISVQGSAVKGPLANADIAVYTIDPNADDLKGRLIAEGSSNDNAQIDDIQINSRRLDEYFLIEIKANDNTIDLTTGKAPLIKTFLSIVSMNSIAVDGDEDIVV